MLTVVVLGLPMLIIYAFGIPFAAWKLLQMSRKPDIEPDEKRRVSFLSSGYKRVSFDWEVQVLLRKLFMTSVVVFFSSVGPKIQVLTSSAGLCVFLSLHYVRQPYLDQELNRVETCSLLTVIISIFFGMYLIDTENVNGVMAFVIQIFIVGINVIWALFFLKVRSHPIAFIIFLKCFRFQLFGL